MIPVNLPEIYREKLKTGCFHMVRAAISLGGDSDTLACITGGIAEAFYGDIPDYIQEKVRECLSPELWQITEAFCQRYR